MNFFLQKKTRCAKHGTAIRVMLLEQNNSLTINGVDLSFFSPPLPLSLL